MGKIYFPILMGRLGEINAISRLSPRAKARSQIMLDLLLPRKDRNLEVHLAGIVQAAAQWWGTTGTICLDMSRYSPEVVTADGRLAVDFVFDFARQCRLQAIPVSGPASVRGPGTAYLDAVRRIAVHGGRGAAIRIQFEDLDAGEVLNDSVDECLRTLELNEGQVDLYLDCGILWKQPAGVRTSTGLSLIWSTTFSALRSRSFRNIAFCASSIPETFKKSADGAPHRVARTEMISWQDLISKENIPIGVGDYAARYAHQREADGPVNPPSRVHIASISEHLLYWNERSGHRETCRRAAESNEFLDQANSWGKFQIRDCGLGSIGIGVPQDWAARDTHMHIETTVRILESELHKRGILAELIADEADTTAWEQLSIVDES